MPPGQRAMRTFEHEDVLPTDLTHLSCEYLYNLLMTAGPGNKPVSYLTASAIIQEKHGIYMSSVRIQRHVRRYLEANPAAPYPPAVRGRTWEEIERVRRGLPAGSDLEAASVFDDSDLPTDIHEASLT